MNEISYNDVPMTDLEGEIDADRHRPAERPARKPLTDVTWAGTLRGQYLSRHLADTLKLGWPALGDLAAQLRTVHPHLTEQACRILVDATANGRLPVLVTRRNGHREIGTIGELGGCLNSSLVVHTWGFSNRIRLDDLVNAELPSTLLGDCANCGH